MGREEQHLDEAKVLVCRHMETTAAEAEETYRNFLTIYTEEFGPATIAGSGLLKAKLHACVFLVHAFIRAWPGRERDAVEMAELAGCVAADEQLATRGDSSITPEEAREIAAVLIKRVLSSISDELKNASPKSNDETQGFCDLMQLYHESLSDSIGSSEYTDEVRRRFEQPIRRQVISALHHSAEVCHNLYPASSPQRRRKSRKR